MKLLYLLEGGGSVEVYSESWSLVLYINQNPKKLSNFLKKMCGVNFVKNLMEGDSIQYRRTYRGKSRFVLWVS